MYKNNFKQLCDKMWSMIPKSKNVDDVIFLAVGTDRSSGDSLAPMVGTILEQLGYTNVYGTIDNPVHAVNLEKVVTSLPKNKLIIAIDASLGSRHSIGKIDIKKEPLHPGAGVGKELIPVGDVSITGVVNIGGFMEYSILRNTRLSVVMSLANQIVDVILHRFPFEVPYDEVAVTKQFIQTEEKTLITRT